MILRHPEREVKVEGQKLGTLKSFKYLGALVLMIAPNQRFSKGCTSHCSSNKAESNMERKLKSEAEAPLVIFIFLYAAFESRILTAELQKRTQGFETICSWRLLNISYKDVFTNEEFAEIQAATGAYDELLTLVNV